MRIFVFFVMTRLFADSVFLIVIGVQGHLELLKQGIKSLPQFGVFTMIGLSGDIALDVFNIAKREFESHSFSIH